MATTWVLVIFLWTGSVMNGTPVDSFSTFEACRVALERLVKEVGPPPGELQLICWPEASSKAVRPNLPPGARL